MAILVQHVYVLEDVCHAAAVRARVHEAGPANGTGNATRKLKARKPQLACHLGGLTQGHTRLAPHLVVIDAHANEAVSHGNNHAAVPLVRNQKVRAAAQHEVRHSLLLAGIDNVMDLVKVLGNHKEVGRTANLERRVLAHRLVHKDVVLANNRAKLPGERLQVVVAGSATFGHLAPQFGFCTLHTRAWLLSIAR